MIGYEGLAHPSLRQGGEHRGCMGLCRVCVGALLGSLASVKRVGECCCCGGRQDMQGVDEFVNVVRGSGELQGVHCEDVGVDG